jgi:hypothetical protein
MSTNGAPRPLPSLPIVTIDPPPKSQAEKYGAALYLGLVGLAVVIALVGWFGYRVWTMRDVWRNVYVLNDGEQPEERRLQAALDLRRDPQFEPWQLWELSLHRELPDRARYLLAEGVGADLVAADPRGYASAVSRSEGWPDWLRIALARPLAYASAEGHTLSRERLAELCRLGDPQLRLWALCALAMQTRPDAEPQGEIDRIAAQDTPERELAQLFQKAIAADKAGRIAALDEATAWTRAHHPGVSRLWNGWDLRDGRIERATPSP